LELSARLLADERWRELFEELRTALREVSELEPKVLDDTATQAEWTAAWAQYAGLLGRIAHLHQRLQSRRVELLDD
jgi:hypothetical protein